MEVDSSGRLRVGLVGCGRIGTCTAERLRTSLPNGWLPLSHADAIRAVPDLDLVALCDVDEGSLQRASAAYGVTSCTTDYQALILETRPDVLSVATRTAGRCEIVEFSARHGVRGIHAEKPFSRSLSDCRRALAVAGEYDVKVSYGTTRRFMDVYRLARRVIESGEIGALVEVSIEHGRTLALWSHPHSVDLILFFGGSTRVESVEASCEIDAAAVSANAVDADPIVDRAVVRLGNGVRGVITSAPGMNTVLTGETGRVVVGADGGWIEIEKHMGTKRSRRLQTNRLTITPEMSGTQRAFHELAAAIRLNRALAIAPAEIETGQAVLLGIVLSSLRGGTRLSPSDVDPDFTVTGRYGAFNA